MTDKLKLAYAAGLVDGEGCVFVKKTDYRIRNPKYGDCKNPQYMPRINIKMVTPEPLVFLKELFGGPLYNEQKIAPCNTGYKQRKLLWVWSVSDRQAIVACKAILPYSIVKRKNIENLLQLAKFKENSTRLPNVGKTGGRAYSTESLCNFEQCYIKSKELNA